MKIKATTNLIIILGILLGCGAAFAQDEPCPGANCDDAFHNEAPVSDANAVRLPQTSGSDQGSLSPQNVPTADRERALRQQQQANPEEKTEAQRRLCSGSQCAPTSPEEKTEFQKFIFTTTGEKLQIYGRNLFKTTPSTFAPVDHIPVPADYVVGPGDELLIRAWGQVDFNARVRVDRNGEVYLPRVGTLNVAGIRYDQLTVYLKNAVGRVFRNFDLTVTLGQLRSIQIYVVGQALRPGSFTVSSLSTLVSALFASGGPSVNGSMRHIELKRQNRVITEFDLYDLLSRGDKSKDVALLPGDVIYIPPVGKQVAVTGSVNLPAIYEIDDETSIKDQIATAGGLTATADGTRVLLERIDDRTTRTIRELNFDEKALSETLHDGDILRVFPISPKIDGSVILRGNVAAPGRYPWHEGMRVSDLIPSKDALITREYWMAEASLSRPSKPWKSVDTKQIEPAGTEPRTLNAPANATLQPETEETQANETTSNQNDKKDPNRAWTDGQLQDERTTIVRARSGINWDYAVVQRLNRNDLSSELLTFSLGNAIDNKASTDNLVLQSGDVITIFSQRDLAVPEQRRTKFVWVEGEVKAPGVYRATPGETLRDLVQRAGGLTTSAYLYASEFRRVSTREEQQKELDELIHSAERDLRTRARLVSASLDPADKTAGQQELQYEQAEVEKLRTVQVTGRIVLDLKPDDDQIAALPAIALEDGDRLIIPARPATIGVVGAVYNHNSFLYQEHNTISTYLALAGGATRDADTARLFVLRANGSVISKQMHRSIWAGSFEHVYLFPGDAIVMPEKVKTTSVLKSIRDWMNALGQYAVTGALLATR